MLDEQDLTNIDEKGIPFTVRSVFIIDPNKKIRLTLQYPVSNLIRLEAPRTLFLHHTDCPSVLSFAFASCFFRPSQLFRPRPDVNSLRSFDALTVYNWVIKIV